MDTIKILLAAWGIGLAAMAVAQKTAGQRQLPRGADVQARGLAFDPEDVGDDAPLALRELLRAYRTQPRYANRMAGSRVEPLLSTVRHQSAPFNGSCPYYTYDNGTVSASRCVSGCVATCIEQVMTHWRHPAELADTLWGWQTDHYAVDDVPPGTAVDWANVLDDYGGGYTDEQARAVADLTYWCGMAAHMSWAPSASGASLYRAFEPLWRVFDYQTLAFVQRCLYSQAAWNRLLRNELEQGRPVCYTGHNMALDGHAFNIDGVDEDGYYHVNWGYGGEYDGWYDLDWLNPFEPASDATQLGLNEGFFANQTALFLHPEDFVIDIFDTLDLDRCLYGVRVDSVTWRRQPDTQGYVVADFRLTNTTADSVRFTFEALTYAPGDTAVFAAADYVALTSVNMNPGQSLTWPVYCQFGITGERVFGISPDGDSITWSVPVTVEQGTEPVLLFGDMSHSLTLYGSDLTATLSMEVQNAAASGAAGDLVTFCLYEGGSDTDTRHWQVLNLPAGQTDTLTATFRNLTDGETYTAIARCPWTVRQTCQFTARQDEAADCITSMGKKKPDGLCTDLLGRVTNRPVRGVYVRRGKKVLAR